MSENAFKPGDVVRHVHKPFDHIDLFVVKVLDSGSILCRYKSYYNPEKGTNSQFILHQMEFELFELVPYEEKQAQVLSAYFP